MPKKAENKKGALTLKLAYIALLDNRPLCARIGMAKQTISNQRYRAVLGLFPSMEKMRERLVKAGWTLAVEEQWAPTHVAAVKQTKKEWSPAFKPLAPRVDPRLTADLQVKSGPKKGAKVSKTEQWARRELKKLRAKSKR